MIITCPACSTRYTIDTVHLGTAGRLVRCSACGEQWHAQAEKSRSAAAPAMAFAPAAPPPPVAPPPPPPPLRADPPPPPRAQPAPPPPPPTAPKESPPPPAARRPAEEEDEENGIGAAENPLSQAELDSMFAEPEPVEPLVAEEEDETAPDDIPDPEPIPQVFTDPDSILEEEERPVSAWLVALAAVLVVAGLLGGLYFARDGVMKMVPASRAIYNLIGLGGEQLGAGLEIRNIDFERPTEGNANVLIVSGLIVNTDQQPRPVPLIRVVLYDAASNPLEDMVLSPAEANLQPGKDLEFRARFADPSPLARRMEVTFAEPPAAAGH